MFAEQSAVYREPLFSSEQLHLLKTEEFVNGLHYLHVPTDEEWLIVQQPDGTKGYVPVSTLMRVHPDNLAEGNLPIGHEIISRWWAVPLSYEPDDLVMIPPKYVQDSAQYLVRKETLEPLLEMLQAALGEGIDIRVNSAYRSGERQLYLYTNAVRRNGAAQRYSAPPGHSEHQLGTTIDLTDPEGLHAFSGDFDKTPQGQWLEKNAGRFGFIRSYRDTNTEETGYISEPWHWRYFGRP